MITSHERGHKIIFEHGEWRYADTGETRLEPGRPCVRCGRTPTPEGYDACLGHIPGVTDACCGHGVTEPYIIGPIGSGFQAHISTDGITLFDTTAEGLYIDEQHALRMSWQEFDKVLGLVRQFWRKLRRD